MHEDKRKKTGHYVAIDSRFFSTVREIFAAKPHNPVQRRANQLASGQR
jgi:hypothetical protein